MNSGAPEGDRPLGPYFLKHVPIVKPNTRHSRRILIVNLGGIGDFLLSTPALRLLRSHDPDAQLVFLGVPRVCVYVQTLDLFDEVFSLGIFDAGTRRFMLDKIEQIFVVCSVLRARKFDLAINMRSIVSWPSAGKIFLLFYFIRAQTWVGRNTDGKGYFFHIKVPETLRTDTYEMVYDLRT